MTVIGSMSLGLVADRLGGQLLGSDVDFARVSTDTRSLQRGDAYLALVGEHFDGNRFLAEAAAAGASAAIVSRDSVPDDLPCVLVSDTHAALGALAHENRLRSAATVIALTGSQGKTTVKEMIGAILKVVAPTLVTEANLNNTIGVPLTLLQLDNEHEFAVIEMGANGAGEIDFSARVAEPDIVMITNASAAHIEGFGSLQGIVRAKGEILDHLRKEGVALLNAHDANVDAWRERLGDGTLRLFGFSEGAVRPDYSAAELRVDGEGQQRFLLRTPQGEAEIRLGLLGRHNVGNAVAAAAAALEAGADLDAVVAGLASAKPVAGRLNPLAGPHGSLLIDDSYNASPGSFRAAIDVLMARPGRRILVAGDMRELGAETEAAHREVGAYAREAGVGELLAIGEDSRETVSAFGTSGELFADFESLASACMARAGSDVTFLIKGSRGARMDKLIDALRAEGEH